MSSFEANFSYRFACCNISLLRLRWVLHNGTGKLFDWEKTLVSRTQKGYFCNAFFAIQNQMTIIATVVRKVLSLAEDFKLY